MYRWYSVTLILELLSQVVDAVGEEMQSTEQTTGREVVLLLALVHL